MSISASRPCPHLEPYCDASAARQGRSQSHLIVGIRAAARVWESLHTLNDLPSIGIVVGWTWAVLSRPRFGLSAAAAIAPTDRQFYAGDRADRGSGLVLRDLRRKESDVSNFEGYHTFERAHAVDLANPTVLSREIQGECGAQREPQPVQQYLDAECPRGRDDARQPGAGRKVHLGALAQAVLLTGRRYRRRVARSRDAVGALPPGTQVRRTTRSERTLVSTIRRACRPVGGAGAGSGGRRRRDRDPCAITPADRRRSPRQSRSGFSGGRWARDCC